MGNFLSLGLTGRVGTFPHAFDGHGPSEERRRVVRKAPEELVQPRHVRALRPFRTILAGGRPVQRASALFLRERDAMLVHNRQTKHAPSSYYENLSVPLFPPNRLGEGEGAGEGAGEGEGEGAGAGGCWAD